MFYQVHLIMLEIELTVFNVVTGWMYRYMCSTIAATVYLNIEQNLVLHAAII